MTTRPLLTALLLAAACGSSPVPTSGPDARVPADSARSGDDASGSGGSGGSASGTDPADAGPLVATSRTATIPVTGGKSVAATVYTPTGGDATRPLVVISPGFQMARAQYASYAQHLATWGFVVVLADYADSSFFADHQTMANDVTKVIDWALAQSALATDPAKIATAGHSLGGDISVLAASGDARIRAVVGWDPVDASSPSVVPEHMGHMTAAIAVIGETTDSSGGFMPCAPAGDNFQAFYAAAPSPSLAITIAGASHMDWVDDSSCAECSLCTAGTAPPETAHTMSRRLAVAWLRTRLLGDTSMAAWLDAPPEVAAHAATIVTK